MRLGLASWRPRRPDRLSSSISSTPITALSRIVRSSPGRHWHIALANGLGWGFDGMNGVLFELLSPLIIKEFALDIPTYRSGFQIWLSLGITGLYVWPWLADRFGRCRLLAVNIAMFSLMMPIVALSPGF